MKKFAIIAALITMFVLAAGCSSLKNNVIVSTGTFLGAQIAENPASQLYEAKFGYGRAEFAIIPGNTNAPDTVPDVIMEIRMDNILKGGAVYQRLAVGKNAVNQPGASLMFAKDATGNLNPAVAVSINSKINSIPTAPK
jgi:hypothetical protein